MHLCCTSKAFRPFIDIQTCCLHCLQRFFYASGYIFFVSSVAKVGEELVNDGIHMSFSYFLRPCVARLTRNGFCPLPFSGSSFVLSFGLFHDRVVAFA
jgi:hypothetical protein